MPDKKSYSPVIKKLATKSNSELPSRSISTNTIDSTYRKHFDPINNLKINSTSRFSNKNNQNAGQSGTPNNNMNYRAISFDDTLTVDFSERASTFTTSKFSESPFFQNQNTVVVIINL